MSTTTADVLRSALSELALARATMTDLQTQKRAVDAEHAQRFAALAEAITLTGMRVMKADEQVRQLALTVHEMTGEKKAVEGASVVIKVTYEYDAAEAMVWAKAALPTAIITKLDTKAIDKIASTGVLPFAKKIETPAVQIATDLSEYTRIPEPENV